jgi:hypothetical protein
MPFPEIYSTILFIAVALFCAVTAIVSVPFYNTLHRKSLLSETRPTRRASSPLIYILCGISGIAVGVCFALKDISATDIFVILMIPAAVTVSICDALNGFVPAAGLVFCGICVVLRTAAVCVAESSAWQILTFVSGAVFGTGLMLLINLIAKKTGSVAADTGHIVLIAIIFAASGIVPGTAILAAAEIAALLFYILPTYVITKKNGENIAFSAVKYPLAPFLFIMFYAGAAISLFR